MDDLTESLGFITSITAYVELCLSSLIIEGALLSSNMNHIMQDRKMSEAPPNNDHHVAALYTDALGFSSWPENLFTLKLSIETTV